MTFDPNLLLELFNGSGMIVDGIFLAWCVWYLWRETGRRKDQQPELRSVWTWWLHLPPAMNFIVAVLVHDSGVWMRSVVIWVWRRFYGAGDFGIAQGALMTLGGLAIVVGGLCKIRAVTKPFYGDGPWLTTLYLVLVFLAGSLLNR